MASDKAYSAEKRLNALWNHLGPVAAGGGNGQRQSFFLTANQPITSTSQAIVGVNSVPLSWPVVAGQYLLYAELCWIPDAGINAGNAFFRVTLGGGAAVNMRVTHYLWALAGSQLANQVTAMDTDMGSSTMAAGAVYQSVISGSLNLGGAATLSLAARSSASIDTYKIQSYSFGTLESVGQTS